MKLGLIGGGNMGFAFAKSVVGNGLISPQNLVVVEREARRRDTLDSNIPCHILETPGKELSSCSILVLAVKPQDFPVAAEALRPFVKPEQVILSLMAGVTLATLGDRLGHPPFLVRSIPNLPFQIGKGMTVFTALSTVTVDHLAAVEKLLKACGDTLQVENEDLLDGATAISGSGPGFVYYWIEQFLQSARALGFTDQEANQLVAKTFEGAVDLWIKSGAHPEDLRHMVTSAGGTTAAAVEMFDKEKIGEIFQNGLNRAYERSRELADKA